MLDQPLDLNPDALLTTTRSVRKRLDFDRPVERSVVEECVRLAVQAPSGSNRQSWHWVFVSDPVKKAAIAEVYKQLFDEAYPPGYVEGSDPAGRRLWSSAAYLAANLARVPLMLVPCQWGRLREPSVRDQASFWGSLLPAVWSFMLALRSRGLGSAWTTLHLGREEEVAAILDIPYERCTQGGLFPIAYTIGTDFKPGPRKPLQGIVHWDSW